MPFHLSEAEKSSYTPVGSDDNLIQRDEENTPVSFQHHRIYTILVFTAIFLFGFVVSSILGPFVSQRWASTTVFGNNPHSPIPSDVFNRHPVVFNPDERYIGPSKEVNQNWKELTKGSDSIYLPNPAAHNLTDPGIAAPFFLFNSPPQAATPLSKNFYVLSPLHQLHCVNMIRMRYNDLVYSPAQSPNEGPLSGSPIDADWLTHVEHCFEYLRLSVTCGDFFVFESDSPPGTPEPLTRDGLGWGVVHQCVDWEGLMRYQEDMVIVYNASWTSLN